MAYKKILLTSSAVDLHGILLRERIRAAMVKRWGKEVKGSVGNIAQGVEIIFEDGQVNEEELIRLLQNVVLSNELIRRDFRNWDYYGITEAMDAPPSEEFSITRSNELQETVWALQGAGKVFARIADQIKERDGKKLLGVLKGVRYEIYFNSAPSSGDYFHTKAMEGYLCSIPYEEKGLVELMQEYLLVCKQNPQSGVKTSKLGNVGESIVAILEKKIVDLEREMGLGSNKNTAGDEINDEREDAGEA
jgi:hypothetical protein